MFLVKMVGKISVWKRHSIFVFVVGMVYTIAVIALLKAARFQDHVSDVSEHESERSTAPTAPNFTDMHVVHAAAYGDIHRKKDVQSLAYTTPYVEMVSGTSADEPRIFIVHNLLTEAECEHLISLALRRGLQHAHARKLNIGDSEWKRGTNKQVWLGYHEDHVVKGIEERIAKLTKTYPEQGENLQVLHYGNNKQLTRSEEHHDFMDPRTDPPPDEEGGNRRITTIMYLSAVEEGGETEFPEIDKKILVGKGSAIMFYNLKHGCNGSHSSCVDAATLHAGLKPTKGEKWVATKWIRERAHQNRNVEEGCVDKHPRCQEWSRRSPSECNVNREWMSRNCHKSCKYCIA